MAQSKRFLEAKKLVDKTKKYSPIEAIDLAKKTATTKFVGSVEVHVRLGIDPKKTDQTVRSTLVLPHSTGKTKKVAAFVGAEKEKDAKEAGADIVGGEELINEIIQSNKIDFEVAVATPDMMPKLAKLAKVLGPKGLMPNPKTDTVGPNVKKMVEELKKGKIAFKNDVAGIIHQAIGKTSLEANQLVENLNALMDTIRKNKPASAKGAYLKNVTVTTTMGPGISVDPSYFA
ncbi:MAG: 50S ribosomal protein L1 [Patescibacteria group bacterium]|nr:50S ribosomal protein L1 [Patescibacteria group bacterium]